MEIFDDMGVKDPEVRKKLKLSTPRFNFGAKQESELLGTLPPPVRLAHDTV